MKEFYETIALHPWLVIPVGAIMIIITIAIVTGIEDIIKAKHK